MLPACTVTGTEVENVAVQTMMSVPAMPTVRR